MVTFEGHRQSTSSDGAGLGARREHLGSQDGGDQPQLAERIGLLVHFDRPLRTLKALLRVDINDDF